jgi:uncharacterized protein with FMN-binding domain
MKRAALVGAGTVAGVAAILALNPDTVPATAIASPATASSPAAGSSGSGSSSGAVRDGTYTGDTVDIGRSYGTIALEVTVTSGRIVDIAALAVPQNDRRSAQISDYAVPQLVQQALTAQSASIAGLSGATYTSSGFAQSLRSALVAAGLAS